MRYIVDLFKRYEGGWGFVGANLEGYFNKGIFAAGIAYNEARYKARKAKAVGDKDYKLETYTETDYNFSDIEFDYKGLKLRFGLSTSEDKYFAPPPMVAFKRSKNITVTSIDNNNESEIVENFGLQSWDIDIKGLIIDMEEHHYPAAKLSELADYFTINDVVEVCSPMFNDLGIHSLYFKDITIEPVEAFPDTIRFSLTCKSIKPAEFTLING